MRSRRTDSTHLPQFPSSKASNAFDAELLRRLGEGEQPPNTEAAVAGPWSVVAAAAGGWACSTPGEAEPEVVAREREVALLAAAALPPSGRQPRFRLVDAPERPFPFLDFGEAAGTIACYRQELVTAMNVLDGVLRSPLCLAFLIEAAGAEVVERTGRVLLAQLPSARLLADRMPADGLPEGGEA